MSNQYLVTEPGLTYLTFGQRLTPSQLAEAQADFGEDSFIAAPYTQNLQRTLRSHLNLRTFVK